MTERDDWKERLHTSVEHMPGLEGEDGPDGPRLNSFDVVNAIVREFYSDMICRCSEAVGSDKPSEMEHFATWVKSQCDRYNALFIGPGLPHSMPHTRGPRNTPDPSLGTTS